MESQWYFFYGQTPENTKISDRAHALHIRREEWNKITKHLDRQKLIQEALDKEKNHKIALKEGSEAMTKNWHNSIENIRKRKEEEREKRTGIKEVDKLQKYYEIRKEQENKREEFLKRVKREMFRSKGCCRELTSALVASEVFLEREKQLEFQKFLDEHRKEEDRMYAEKVKKDAEAEKMEKVEEIKKAKEKKVEIGKIFRKEMEEAEKKKKEYQENKVRKEAEDIVRARKMIEECAQLEREEKLKRKLEMKKMNLMGLERKRELKEIAKREDEEMDEVIQLYSEAKKRINCMRKQKEQEIMQAFIDRRATAAGQIETMDRNRLEQQEAILENAVQEREAELLELEKARLEKIEKARQDRIEDRRQFLERQELEKKKEEEVKKWEMLNRFKTDEASKIYEQKKKEKQWEKILAYRKEILAQMAEQSQIPLQEKEEQLLWNEAILAAHHKEDELFLIYADEVLKHCEKKGLNSYPVQKVIMQYKRDNGLIPRKATNHVCQNYRTRPRGKKVWLEKDKSHSDTNCEPCKKS